MTAYELREIARRHRARRMSEQFKDGVIMIVFDNKSNAILCHDELLDIFNEDQAFRHGLNVSINSIHLEEPDL